MISSFGQLAGNDLEGILPSEHEGAVISNRIKCLSILDLAFNLQRSTRHPSSLYFRYTPFYRMHGMIQNACEIEIEQYWCKYTALLDAIGNLKGLRGGATGNHVTHHAIIEKPD